MPRPRKSDKPAKRESPVQFRLESDLGRLVGGFAERHGLGVNEAAKSLIALCVVSLDCRYYGLVRQLADELGGSNPFVQAYLRVNASMEGAAMATGRPVIPDAARPGFVLRVVEGVLTGRGKPVKTDGLWFVEGNSLPPPGEGAVPEGSEEEKTVIDRSVRKRRTIRRVDPE